MLVTRGLRWAGVAALGGLSGGLVTSCENETTIGKRAAAAGGQAEFSSMAAGAADVGQSPAVSAGRGQTATGGGGAGTFQAPGGPTDVPVAGGDAIASGGGHGVEPNHYYPGQGFIVHEWGTDTIVVGSDGSLQRGLHHEEEDLPPFVYDRIKAGTSIGAGASPSVTIKMETPVSYFYSPAPLLVNARVEFPKGVLTQWYPGVTTFLPPVAAAGSVTYPALPGALADPALDLGFPFVGEICRAKYASLSGGLLDWGNFSIQGRGVIPEKALPSAPLDRFGWGYAREVDANLLQMPNGESERFLFYRGLGEFDLPMKIQAGEAEKVKLTNGFAEPVAHLFLLNVSHDRGVFAEHSEGIAPGTTLEDSVPSLVGAASVDEYLSQLSEAVTEALDATGLYHDEAIAMVNTWRRQWFRTPGVRALYLVPQSWTDQSIPLTVSPKPDVTVRVMLIRAELITKGQEAADVSALSVFDSDPVSGAAYFSDLGRFAEPRLRRALQLSASVAGEQYLSQIARAKSSVVSSE